MRVLWTRAARRDRLGVRTFIEKDNPQAAVRMDRLFAQAATRLREFPLIGQLGLLSGTRELFPHESYRLVYQVEDDTVFILALVHTARQWPPQAE